MKYVTYLVFLFLISISSSTLAAETYFYITPLNKILLENNQYVTSFNKNASLYIISKTQYNKHKDDLINAILSKNIVTKHILLDAKESLVPLLNIPNDIYVFVTECDNEWHVQDTIIKTDGGIFMTDGESLHPRVKLLMTVKTIDARE